MIETTARPQRGGSVRTLRQRAVVLASVVTLITPVALATLALPAAASSVPGEPGAPIAIGMQGAAALQWSAPFDPGTPSLTRYRVEANDGSGWSTATANDGATALVAGDRFSCALLNTGSVKCWGDNADGQLGLGDTTQRGVGAGEMGDNLPTVDLGGQIVQSIAAGDFHACALLDNATVKCWGRNASGQLGQGDTTNRGDSGAVGHEMGAGLPPIDLGTGRTAVAITAGNAHTCALLDNGTVKCWGDNTYGQLGLGNTANRGDAANEMGDNLPAVNLGSGRIAVAISAHRLHTCALLDNGTVKCWGRNDQGQLGQGDTANRGDGAGEMGDNLPAVDLGTNRTAVSVVAGDDDTCAMLDNSTVKCWGTNTFGQLGLGDQVNRGDSGASGHEMGDNLPAVNLGTDRTAVSITVSRGHTCAVLDNATAKCWGYGGNGELGLGTTAAWGDGPNEMGDSLPAIALGTGRTATAIAGGGYHTCALLDNAAVKCWGQNESGQLGQGDTVQRGDGANEMGNFLPVIDLGTVGLQATAISAGGSHTCALFGNGSVKCWGRNNLGQLGLGDNTNRGDAAGEMGANLPAVDLGTNRTAVAISTGNEHTCALLDNGTVKCWGSSLYGQLGLGTNAPRGDAPNEMGNNLPIVPLGTGHTAVAISAGANHTCAILDNNTVKCWGRNAEGQLGLGNTNDRGDQPNEMGANLPIVPLGTGRTAVSISAGGNSSCAVLDNNTMKCWGYNGDGQLGLGDTNNRGDQPNEMGVNLPAINLGTGGLSPVAIAAGLHTCALLNDFSVKCWGANFSGELGQGTTTSVGDNSGEMGDNLPPIDLGTGRSAVAIASAASHTCAVLDDSSVKCWGGNSNGELGLGDTTSRGGNPNEMGDNLPAVDLGTGHFSLAISAVGAHSCAWLDDASVKCWGYNAYGQLGLGDTTNRGDGGGLMGNDLPAVLLADPQPGAAATSAVVRLAPGTYTLRVVALNSVGASAPSAASAPITVTGPPVADAPTSVTGTPGNHQIGLTWTTPASDGGYPITDYQVSVFSDTGGAATGVTGATVRLVGSATTSYTFTGLTNGTAYTFSVAAVTAVGAGAESVPSAAVSPASFTVPASSAGYATGFTVNNSVTLTASGSWCSSTGVCSGPNGSGSPTAGYLEPTATPRALVGRIGASGPWTKIGSGPSTLNGNGQLFLAMNDLLGGYGDNTGVMYVNIAADLQLTSSYAAGGPVLAAGSSGWSGFVINNTEATLTNLTVEASAGLELTAAQTSVPTWSYYDGVNTFPATPCTRVTPGASIYSCAVPSLAPGQEMTVNANVLPQGLAPQTIHDQLGIADSDQTGSCPLLTCSNGAPVAPQASQIVDGLQFNVTAPATVNAGTPLTISRSVTNTSSTQTINDIVTFASFDKGNITSASACTSANNTPLGTGAAARCPAAGTFDQAPASTSASASVSIDTTNLVGKTINYTMFATSPDLGGSSYVASGSVFVAAPAGQVVIATPANGAKLGRTQPNEFTAVPSPGAGFNVTSVDLQVDALTPVNVAAPGPYTRTLPANSLAPGTHTLKAIMHQDGGGPDAQTTITVQVADAPLVTIVPPSGFAPGGSLNTSKTFSATVTPGSPATISSVVWAIDNSIPVPSATASPYSATVNPATLVLTNGSHMLRATATDSLGQTTVAAFSFTVPLAALSIPTITPLADAITPGGDAAWSIQVNNNNATAIARHVTLTLNAAATDNTSATTALTFDTAAINGTLHLPPSADTCMPGVGTTVICNVPDIPAASGVMFPIFVHTDGLTNDTTITADTDGAAANAAATSPQPLDPVNVITCGDACVKGVAAAGTAFGSDPTHTAPTEQAVMLSKGLTSTAHGVPYGQTFQLGGGSRERWGKVTFAPRVVIDANAIAIGLNSIDPVVSVDPGVNNACPKSGTTTITTPCKGEVSEVTGNYSVFTNKADPIVTVIIGRWGSTLPTGNIFIQKPANSSGVYPAPVQLPACTVDPVLRTFNTPCTLPQVLKTLVTLAGTTYTTYNTVLFTGNDPFFVRR